MSIAPVLPLPVLVPTTLALAGWAASLAVRRRPRARGATLACLRALAVVVFGVCLLRPCVEGEALLPAGGDGEGLRPSAFVLAERGARALPPELRARLGACGRGGAVERVEFDRADSRTGLEDALARALVACGARPSAALVLLGSPAGAVSSCARLGVGGARVFVVAREEADGPRVAVGAVEVTPAEPVEGRSAVASVELCGSAPRGVRVRLRWTLDGRELASRTVRAPAPGSPVRAEHAFVVPSGGLHRLRVEAALRDEAAVDDNSSAAFFLARPGPVRVLIAEGPPRRAYRALRRALASDGRFAVSASCSVERLPRARLLPRDETEWSGLDVVFLGDVGAAELAPGALARLARFVREGGGLVVVAGERNLGPGGWGRTPIADVLPVIVSPGDGPVEGPLDVRPAGRAGTPRPYPFGSGLAGGVGAVTSERTELRTRSAEWRALPELERARAVAGTTGDAKVPVIAVRPGSSVPMLVHCRAGKGRVIVILSGDLPRWAAAGSAGRIAHDEFWRDVALGAAPSAPDDGLRVWLDPPARAARAGEPLRLTAYLSDPSAPGSVLVEFESASGGRSREALGLAPRGLVRTFEVTPPAEGKLTLRASAGPAGGEARSAAVELAVAPAGADGPASPATGADAEAGEGRRRGYLDKLRAVCRASGGRFATSDAPAAAVEGFAGAVARTPPEAGAPGSPRDVVPPPALLAAFVALLVAEWALRRSWRME
jgi:uncharacterized membrane protein